MPSTRAPRAPSGSWVVASGTCPRPASSPGGRDEPSGACGRARGRVDLARVVQLDDLDGLVEPRRLRGEPHHEDRADGEVRGDEDADLGTLRQLVPERGQALVVPAGGPDDHVHPALDAVGDVGRRGVRHRELDGDVRSPEVAEVVAVAHAGHQLEALGRLDGAARLGAHAPGGADDCHPDRLAHGRQRSHPAYTACHGHTARTTRPAARLEAVRHLVAQGRARLRPDPPLVSAAATARCRPAARAPPGRGPRSGRDRGRGSRCRGSCTGCTPAPRTRRS